MKQLLIPISMSILLVSVASAASIMPIKCDGSAATNEFEENESICVYGTGFEANQTVDIYVVENQDNYNSGETITDITGEVETVQTTSKGILILKNIWDYVVKGVYDIIADLNKNTQYDSEDIVNVANGEITVNGKDNPVDNPEDPVVEVPEFSTIAAILLLAIAGLFIQKKRKVSA